MRLRTGYLDMQAKDLDEALTIIERAGKEKKAVSVGRARQRGGDLSRTACGAA